MFMFRYERQVDRIGLVGVMRRYVLADDGQCDAKALFDHGAIRNGSRRANVDLLDTGDGPKRLDTLAEIGALGGSEVWNEIKIYGMDEHGTRKTGLFRSESNSSNKFLLDPLFFFDHEPFCYTYTYSVFNDHHYTDD